MKFAPVARRRRENFQGLELYTRGNALILPAAGAIFFGFLASIQGKFVDFSAPQAKKIGVIFRKSIKLVVIPPSISKSGGARGGITTWISPDKSSWYFSASAFFSRRCPGPSLIDMQ